MRIKAFIALNTMIKVNLSQLLRPLERSDVTSSTIIVNNTAHSNFNWVFNIQSKILSVTMDALANVDWFLVIISLAGLGILIACNIRIVDYYMNPLDKNMAYFQKVKFQSSLVYFFQMSRM